VTAYNETIWIANDTTFDTDGEGHGCVWMDTLYNWSDPEFRDECGEYLNLAVNVVADVLQLSASRRIQSDAVIITGMGRSRGQMQLSRSGWQ
jgi:hypothetical protein